MSRCVCASCDATDFGARTDHESWCSFYNLDRYVAAWRKAMAQGGFTAEQIDEWEKRTRAEKPAQRTGRW